MALASKRIGLLVPSSNSTVEVEFYRALPADVSVHVARLPITQVNPESIAGMVDPLDAESKKLASADVDVIVLGAAASPAPRRRRSRSSAPTGNRWRSSTGSSAIPACRS